MELATYLKIYADRERPGHFILYSTKKGSMVRLSAAKLEAAKDGTLEEKDREALERLEMLVEDRASEQAAIILLGTLPTFY